MNAIYHIKREIVKVKLEPLLEQVEQLQLALEGLTKVDCSATWHQSVNSMLEAMLKAQERFYQQLNKQKNRSKAMVLGLQYFYEDLQRAMKDFEQLKEEQDCKAVKHQLRQLKTTIYFKMQLMYQQVV